MSQQVSPNHVYVVFSAPIIPATANALMSVLADCANQGVTGVTLLLATPGGSVAVGMHLYSLLRGMPFELTTHNTGDVGSIANLLYLAGETRLTVRHGVFNFHGVGFDMKDGQRLEEKDIMEKLNGLHKDQDRIGNVFVERTRLTQEEARQLFAQASTKDANWAVDKGFSTTIGDVSVPPGAKVFNIGHKA